MKHLISDIINIFTSCKCPLVDRVMIFSEGELNFPTGSERKRPVVKFVRLNDDGNPGKAAEEIIRTMFDRWKLSKPDLVLSLHGATDIQVRLRNGDEDNCMIKGLCRLINTVDSLWLLSNSGDKDVLRIVDGVRTRAEVTDRDKVVSIGFMTSHSVEGKYLDSVTSAKHAVKSFSPANGETMSPAPKRHSVPPSAPPYTHLVLVDLESEEAEDKFQEILTSEIESRLISDNTFKPTIFVQTQIDKKSVRHIKEALAGRRPVVLCEYTGSEHFLSYALQCENIQQFKKRYANHLKRVFYGDVSDSESENLFEEFCDQVHTIMNSKDLIEIYNVTTCDNFDDSILLALLKASGATKEYFFKAFSWNRCDIARRMIFLHNLVLSDDDMAELMTRALCDEKCRLGFIELFLECGLQMENYLTEERLDKLYELTAHQSDVTLVPQETSGCKCYQKSVTDMVRTAMRGQYTRHDDAKPYTDLFIWALLVNRFDLAPFLWLRCVDPIALALVASRFYKYVAGRGFPDPDDGSHRREMACEYEEKACSILTEIENVDPDAAMQLVTRRHPSYGNLDHLELGALASCKKFVAHHTCQMVLDRRWDGDISDAWCSKLIAPVLFPPLIFCRVKFKTEHTCFGKLAAFYDTPMTKFVFNWITWLAFVILFSHVSIYLRRLPFTIADYILHGWLAVLLIDGFWQMLVPPDDRRSIKRTILNYRKSVWNWFDMTALTCAAVAFGLRFYDNATAFEMVKVLYACSCCLFWLRVLRSYIFHQYLGPFIIMIRGMLKEMYWFLWVLVVFIVGFGVAINIILSVERSPNVDILRDIFYFPYFQLYGELFLDAMNTTNDKQIPDTVSSVAFSMFLAVYLIIGNLLLLNILIAIFSGVYQRIEANSRREWRHKRYFLVREYQEKPSLPAPFSICIYIYRIIKYCFSKCQKQGVNNDILYLHGTNVDDERRNLNELELKCLDSYKRRQQQKEQPSLETKLSQLEKRLKHMERILEDNLHQ
ncbi:transient receptor potential cation channel subfamily M member-like 2 [Ptychodera flava]|uniref:transient receptor potential cation channel subfamily M member-like 2 n=1 Tax=Ptychodera flava TaxID=63121 RepID=UPI00396A1BE6